MAEDAADPLAEGNESEVEDTYEEPAPEQAQPRSPPTRSPGRSPSPSQQGRGSQDMYDPNGPSGSARPCGYRPKKRKVSYVWGPPKQRGMEPSYSPCPHIYFKNMRENIQRDGLSRDDWMDILSTPNPTPWVKKGPNGEKLIRYRRKPCSKRVKQLAIPRIALVRANWEEYKGVLSEDMLERLRQILADDFHMTPEEIKEFIKRGKQQCRPKRRKKKKRRKSSIPVELTEEEWMKSLLTEVADNAAEIAEYERPTAPSGRVEEMITTILERLAALAGEPPPPRNATGLVARLMIVIAEKLACWIETIVCEADSMPDETPCVQGLGLLSMLLCSPFCNTLKKMKALMPCCAEKRPHKRRHSKSTKQPKTCCAKIKEIMEEEVPPEPVRFPECKCACRCVQARKRRRGRKGRKKGRGKKRKHGAEGDEDESYEEYEGEEGEGGESDEDDEGGEGDDDEDGGGGKGRGKGKGKGKGKKSGRGRGSRGSAGGGGEDGDDDGGGGGGGGGTEDGGGGGADEGGGEEEGGDEGGDELKGGGSGGVGASKSSKGSSNKSGQSKTSANAAGSKSSANAAGSKSSANAAGSKSSANAAGSKSSANANGSKSPANAGSSKGSANAGGASKSATNAGGSKSSANAGGGGSKSATNTSGTKSPANSGGGSKSATNAAGSKSSANAGGSSKSSANAAKSKSSADAPKSKTSVKDSASKASSKSKTDDGATAYKVTSGEDGVLKVEPQERIDEVAEEPAPGAEEAGAPGQEGGEPSPDEEIEGGGLEAQISEIGDNVAQEAIDEGAANAIDSNLPNVTIGTILRQLSHMIEDLPEGEQSERKDKLMHTLEKKFTSLVEADDEPHSPEGMEEVVANVADKVATWMDGVIREAESRLSAAGGAGTTDLRTVAVPGQVASKEVREWAEWIASVMGVAEDWAGWITTTVSAAEEKAREKKGEVLAPDGTVKKLTRAEWEEWRQGVKKGAIEFRQRKQAVKEIAYEWEKRTKGKKVIPSGQAPATSSNEMQQEEEENVTDMEGGSEKSPTPDSPATEE